MPKKIYQVEVGGQIFKRKTDRVYLFAVTGKRSYDFAMADANNPEWAKNDRKNFAYYEKRLARRDFRFNKEEELRQIVDLGRDGYVAKRLASRVDSVEACKAAGDFDRFCTPSWCGRRDLAEKQAAKDRIYLADVRIIPVDQPA